MLAALFLYRSLRSSIDIDDVDLDALRSEIKEIWQAVGGGKSDFAEYAGWSNNTQFGFEGAVGSGGELQLPPPARIMSTQAAFCRSLGERTVPVPPPTFLPDTTDLRPAVEQAARGGVVGSAAAESGE